MICGLTSPSFDDYLKCNADVTIPVNLLNEDAIQSLKQNIAHDIAKLAKKLEGWNPKGVAGYVGQKWQKHVSKMKEDKADETAAQIN